MTYRGYIIKVTHAGKPSKVDQVELGGFGRWDEEAVANIEQQLRNEGLPETSTVQVVSKLYELSLLESAVLRTTRYNFYVALNPGLRVA